MRIAAALDALLAELAEEIADPLAERFTLGAIALDLYRLAGEEPPAAVVAVLEAPIAGAAD